MIGIDIGKNSFHVVGLDKKGAIVLRQKLSRGQIENRLAGQAISAPESSQKVGYIEQRRALQLNSAAGRRRRRLAQGFTFFVNLV